MGEGVVLPLPIWKALSLGFAALSVGMTLGLAPAYVVSLAGLGAALAFLIGGLGMISIAVAISVFARSYVVTGSLMSYVHHAFGIWATAVVGAALLCGYMVMIPSATAATQVFATGASLALAFPRLMALLVKR